MVRRSIVARSRRRTDGETGEDDFFGEGTPEHAGIERTMLHGSSCLHLSPLSILVCLCSPPPKKKPKNRAKLPDNYACPPCGSIKRRFKKVPKGSASGKVEVKGGGGGGGGFFSF
jgi:hypothetical protein